MTAWGYSGLCPLHDVAKLARGNRPLAQKNEKNFPPNMLIFSGLESGCAWSMSTTRGNSRGRAPYSVKFVGKRI